MIAVVDLDNAYASIEQLFAPQLRQKAVCVTGSNGGNVIARSQRAKSIGIKMGQPRYEIEPLIKSGLAEVRSANFANYHEMTSRVAFLVQSFSPDPIEIYSCDEEFLALDHIASHELDGYVTMLRNEIKCLSGLNVTIGVAPTKTLAKVALDAAKHSPNPVMCLIHPAAITAALEATPVADVWGIGPAKARAIAAIGGATTAREFRDLPVSWVRQQLSVVSVRTQMELQGRVALPLITTRATKQEIGVNRAFGQPLTELADIKQALSAYTARACEKLREQHAVCGMLSVSIATNPFRTKSPQYANHISLYLPRPTAFTPTIVQTAIAGLERIYRRYAFHRVGVVLSQLQSEDIEQYTLFAPHAADPKERALMATIDLLNRKYGREVVKWAGSGLHRTWMSRTENRSPCYLTKWKDIPRAYAG